MTDTSLQPTQATSGQTVETSNDVLIPPGADSYGEDASGFVHGDPTFEVAKLAAFLDEAFPGALDRTNVQVPDSPVDVAIRLLQSLSATAGPHAVIRCDQEYCNKPQGHADEHGIIHSG